MATVEETKILALAQSIYLTKNNRYNDVESTEQADFIAQTIDQVNQFIEELEAEADWNYSLVPNALLGTVDAVGEQTFTLDGTVNHLVISPYRDLVITQDGTVVSTFAVVNPKQITDPSDPYSGDRVTVVGQKLIFSRPFYEHEVGGEVHADVINNIPRLNLTNVEMLDLVKPKQLIILGVAKNATLPDVVQGVISNSLTQKYGDLLQKTIDSNELTSEVYLVPREDFGFIRGAW